MRFEICTVLDVPMLWMETSSDMEPPLPGSWCVDRAVDCLQDAARLYKLSWC